MGHSDVTALGLDVEPAAMGIDAGFHDAALCG